MIRVAKQAEVRKKELVDIAEQLFILHGYEETAVSDIVKKAHVAQGTFYYHFPSKEKVLDAIIERMLRTVEEKVESISSFEGRDAMAKLFTVFQFFNTMGKGREKLMDYLHEERNAPIHFKMEKQIYPRIIPSIGKIISQGVEEGVFNTQFPEEAALAVFVSSNAIQGGKHDHSGREEIKIEDLIPIFDIFDRVLGAELGTFMNYTIKFMEKEKESQYEKERSE